MPLQPCPSLHLAARPAVGHALRRASTAATTLAGLAMLSAPLAHAQTAPRTPATPKASADAWAFGAVLDITHTSRALAMGMRDQGMQLGHSDLTAAGPLGSALRAQITATVATHEGELERGIEEAYVETTRLPAGFSLRAGRFASQIGNLNTQHLHADDFTERPLLYRAFLGGHWNDDGLRLAWTAPAPFYLQLGAEAFRGHRLVPETASTARNPGIATLSAKVGADLNREHSVLLGLSHIRSRRVASLEEEHADEAPAPEGEHDEHEEHTGHAHGGALFSGRKTWVMDATWKWAPAGNNRGEQVRVSLEAARITGLNLPGANAAAARHAALAVAAVWRFRPSWEVGVRADSLRAQQAHGDGVENVRLREQALMLAWKPTHMQLLRLQATRQSGAEAVEQPSRRSLQLQYVMSFGAHGAHAF